MLGRWAIFFLICFLWLEEFRNLSHLRVPLLVSVNKIFSSTASPWLLRPFSPRSSSYFVPEEVISLIPVCMHRREAQTQPEPEHINNLCPHHEDPWWLQELPMDHCSCSGGLCSLVMQLQVPLHFFLCFLHAALEGRAAFEADQG